MKMRTIAMAFIILVLAMMVCLTDCVADTQYKSMGIQPVADGIRITYVADQKSYGVALGAPIWNGSQYGFPQLHSDALAIIRPGDNTQLAAGFAVGYDLHPIPNNPLVLSPLVGVLTDVSASTYGRKTLPFVGISIKLTYQ